jgi:hypothetical protein
VVAWLYLLGLLLFGLLLLCLLLHWLSSLQVQR